MINVWQSERNQTDLNDIQYDDLTDGNDSSAHYHPSDRNRANHTGTQLSSTISDLNTTITNTQDTILVNSIPITETANGIKTSFVVGENVVFGNILYIKSDGKLWKADTSGTDTYPVLYMATETKTADATCNVLKYGYVKNTSWNWTVGGILYLSTTGQITQTQPSTTDYIVQVIGIAINATTINFNPQLSLIKIA